MDAPQAYTIKSFCAAFGISRSLVYREIAVTLPPAPNPV
jgi:hypothetical protein